MPPPAPSAEAAGPPAATSASDADAAPPVADVSDAPAAGCALPALEHELGEEGAHALLSVRVPSVGSSKEIDLSVSDELVELEAPGHAPLRVPLPRKVDSAKTKARFDTKAKRLKITMPLAK